MIKCLAQLALVVAQYPYLQYGVTDNHYHPEQSQPEGSHSYTAQAEISPPTGPSWFDIDQQRRNVHAESYAEPGNDIIFAYPPLTPISSIDKRKAQLIQVNRIRAAQRNYRQTHAGGTIEDHNAMDDLKLQEDAARNQANRRGAELFSSVFPFNAVYDGRSHEASLQLARNQRFDAQQAVVKDPSQGNQLKLREARENIRQQEEWTDAARYDVVGFGNSLGKLGPIKRWQASETALDTAHHDRRQIRQKYAEDPSEDNWWDMRINDVKIRALQADIDANRGETAWKTVFPFNAGSVIAGKFFMNAKFDEEEDHWQRYHRLSLQNLQRKRAKADAAGGYGPAPVYGPGGGYSSPPIYGPAPVYGPGAFYGTQ